MVEIYQMANIEFQPKMGSTPETMGQVLVQRCHLILLFFDHQVIAKKYVVRCLFVKVRSDGVLMNFFVICT